MQTTNPQTQAQGFFSNVRVYKNETKQSLVHVISESSRIEMPIALYKKILGIHFQEKEVSYTAATRPMPYGLTSRPTIYISKDGNYLVHRFLGGCISKHVNYYKKILGVPFTSKAQTA